MMKKFRQKSSSGDRGSIWTYGPSGNGPSGYGSSGYSGSIWTSGPSDSDPSGYGGSIWIYVPSGYVGSTFPNIVGTSYPLPFDDYAPNIFKSIEKIFSRLSSPY